MPPPTRTAIAMMSGIWSELTSRSLSTLNFLNLSRRLILSAFICRARSPSQYTVSREHPPAQPTWRRSVLRSREFRFSTPVAPSISARRSRTLGDGPPGGRTLAQAPSAVDRRRRVDSDGYLGHDEGGALRRGDIGLLGESGVLGVDGVSGAAAGTFGGAPSSLGCRMSPRAVRSSSDEVAVSPFHARGSGCAPVCRVCERGRQVRPTCCHGRGGRS
jgi:hypothetical protein